MSTKIFRQQALRRLLALAKSKQQTQTKQSHYTRFYPGSDLLSTGVLHPVPEQQLRIHYPRVQSPSRRLTHPATTGLLFTTRRGIQHPETLQGITPWNPQVFLQHEGNNTKMCSRDDTPLDQANSTVLDLKRRLREKDLQRRTLSVHKSSLKVLHSTHRAKSYNKKME
ncbi:hypothetical protein Taro_051271 [Colocasia esculenta]|uniref:Uncharacterized protein n=1 Tax=Colocasia esculenta TaxID=4460 RepID=A0A843XG95_COLES|nr:hypothetical protein [Colocasia esculenta]